MTTTAATTKKRSANEVILRINNNTRLINFLSIASPITLFLSLPITAPGGSKATLLQAAVLIIAISPLITISVLVGRGQKLCGTYFQMLTTAASNENTVFFDDKPYTIAHIDDDEATLTLQDNNGIKIRTSFENVTLDKKGNDIHLPWWL